MLVYTQALVLLLEYGAQKWCSGQYTIEMAHIQVPVVESLHVW
jgi:hypothetical protein